MNIPETTLEKFVRIGRKYGLDGDNARRYFLMLLTATEPNMRDDMLNHPAWAFGFAAALTFTRAQHGEDVADEDVKVLFQIVLQAFKSMKDTPYIGKN